MHRTGLKITVFFFLILFGLSLVSAPIVRADEPDLYSDGEPTDPEHAIRVLQDAGIDLDDHSITICTDDDSWFESLLNLLRSLGLLAPGGSGS